MTALDVKDPLVREIQLPSADLLRLKITVRLKNSVGMRDKVTDNLS